jgi:hypothetical protein
MRSHGSEELQRVWRGILASTPPEERLEGLSAEERVADFVASPRKTAGRKDLWTGRVGRGESLRSRRRHAPWLLVLSVSDRAPRASS